MLFDGQYADKANKVPQDGGASSSAAFGGFIRKLITMAAGGVAGAAAGGAAGAAGAGGGNALGAGLYAGEAAAAPSLAAAGASPAMWGEAATGSMGGAFGPMVGLGRGSEISGALGGTPAAPSMGGAFMRGASTGGFKGGLQQMLASYGQSQPAGSALNSFGAGLSRSGNMMGGLQAQFMDPMGAPVLGNMNMFDLTNMGLQRLSAGSNNQRKRNWWEQ